MEGPFKKWIHRHHFEEKGKHTIVQDEIEYEVGMGPLGKIMETLVVNYQIEKFFKDRLEKTTKKIKAIKHKLA